MRAELTRDGDYFLPHRERMLRARRKQADMFISVHADSFHDRSVRRLVRLHVVGSRRIG